ncbi:Hypothetical protein BOM_0064 [Borrelia miyamotoi FR64b]|nr:Hypothetical protein BOM_0064 [Borrelia miyamotoi FR64b]
MQNDKDLIYMKLEAFKRNFSKILAHCFAMYVDDLKFFK